MIKTKTIQLMVSDSTNARTIPLPSVTSINVWINAFLKEFRRRWKPIKQGWKSRNFKPNLSILMISPHTIANASRPSLKTRKFLSIGLLFKLQICFYKSMNSNWQPLAFTLQIPWKKRSNVLRKMKILVWNMLFAWKNLLWKNQLTVLIQIKIPIKNVPFALKNWHSTKKQASFIRSQDSIKKCFIVTKS